MNKKAFEALAFLMNIRNVRKGLITRSKIIRLLKENELSSREIADMINMSYSAIRRQLKMMEKESIVKKVGRKWSLTGYGQREILDFINNPLFQQNTK